MHLTNEFATHYFYNLTENLGENIHDSCGYIGLGMLLGYYDAYWNDSFIDENFEQNANLSTNSFTASVSSSGGKSEKELLNNPMNLYYTDFNWYTTNLVNRPNNQYFHFELIKLGLQKNYSELSNRDFGVDESELYNLTSDYLYTERFSRREVEIETERVQSEQTKYIDSLRIRMFVEERVKQGIPVLITAAVQFGDVITDKHAMIAYDYDFNEETNTNIIYVHTGLRNSNSQVLTHVSLDSTGYGLLTSAIALQPKTNHSHTNNYKYNNTPYCPCSNQTFYQGKVVFENLYCLGTNATLLNNNVPTNYSTPITFSYFNPVSISHMSAQVTSYGYDPHCVFLGWYRDMDFTTKVTSTPTKITGDCILYAKWRVDYSWFALNRTRTVNYVAPENNGRDLIQLDSASIMEDLIDMGITKISIVAYMRFWEVDDGRQLTYIYGGPNGATQLQQQNFNSTVSGNFVDRRMFTIDIEDIYNKETKEFYPNLYLKFGTTNSDGPDVWGNDRLHFEISFTTGEWDLLNNNVPAFTWASDNNLLSEYYLCHES